MRDKGWVCERGGRGWMRGEGEVREGEEGGLEGREKWGRERVDEKGGRSEGGESGREGRGREWLFSIKLHLCFDKLHQITIMQLTNAKRTYCVSVQCTYSIIKIFIIYPVFMIYYRGLCKLGQLWFKIKTLFFS